MSSVLVVQEKSDVDTAAVSSEFRRAKGATRDYVGSRGRTQAFFPATLNFRLRRIEKLVPMPLTKGRRFRTSYRIPDSREDNATVLQQTRDEGALRRPDQLRKPFAVVEAGKTSSAE